MKSYKFYKKQTNSLFLISLFLTSVFLFSCGKNENNNVAKSGEVSIMVSGIDEQVVLTSDIASSQNQKASTQQNTVAGESVAKEQDFEDFSWSLSPDATSNSTSLIRASSVKKSALLASSVMVIGNKYRILFYEVNNGNEVFSESAEVTTSSTRYTLNLKIGVTYRWYAYSYNDAATIPLPADVNNPVIATRTDAPFLYDEGQITTVAATTNMVDIQFDHKVSKIEVKVDALQVFANSFNSLSANYVSLPLTTRGFSLKTGALTGAALSTVNYNGAIVFQNDVSTAKKISTNKLYTATPLTSFQVSFTNIQLNKSGTNVDLISSTPRTATITGFSTSSASLKRGLVTLKYKGGVIGNTEWAQGILYYDPTDPSNPYKISEPFLVGTTHTCNYYWNWYSLLPRSLTGSSTTGYSGDPCKEVLPKNTWRTPTVTDFSNLNVAIANSPENGAVYFNALNGERVYFHEAGWITNSSCTPSNTNDGMYWSSGAYSATKGYTLEIDERGGTGAGNEITDYDKDHGMSIKCVKNSL